MDNQQSTGESHPMEALLDQYLSFGVPQHGDIRVGEIVAQRGGDLLVDIGAKSEGIIPASELGELGAESLANLEIGKEARVFVVDPEDDSGNILLSYAKVAEQEDWERAEDMVSNKTLTECRVYGFNRGGLLVRVFNLRGFMPASQIGRINKAPRNAPTDQQYQPLVGQTLPAIILEAEQSRGRLILSASEAEKAERKQRRSRRIAELQADTVHEGTVINLTDFGAFVDIGDVEGLVHLSELSHKHVTRPHDVLSVGDVVNVHILNIDEKRGRVALSIKQLETDPWQMIDSIYHVGQLIQVTVTQLAKYGAFARIEDEYRFEGLIHISELSTEHVRQPTDVVQKGDQVTARIIRIDPEQRQIGLSLKQVVSDEYRDMDLEIASQ